MNNTVIIAGAGLLVLFYLSDLNNPDDPQSEDMTDTALTLADQAIAAVSAPGPVADMQTSSDMLGQLQRREGCKLTRYQLNDGGYTWGYGHYSRNPNALPLTITQDQADALFMQDVADRGEKWVKLYVQVDLLQNQFDALVSIAYNMSPQSFKKFADAVNNGDGINDMAQTSVAWVASEYTRGIQNRRNDEMNVYNNGIYA